MIDVLSLIGLSLVVTLVGLLLAAGVSLLLRVHRARRHAEHTSLPSRPVEPAPAADEE